MRLALRRGRHRFGPFVVNAGKYGYSSWGLKIFGWSWNSHTRAHRVNLIGPVVATTAPRRRRRRSR
jgi:hypothetical protein